MAAVFARKTEALPLFRGLYPCRRHSHSQTLWEVLLGRKIEPSAAKKLEEAFLEYRVRKAIPSWLPFLPNSSFWIPSTEETVKSLEELAERMKVARPRKERVNALKSPADWPEKGGPVSTVAAWSVIQQTDKLLSVSNWKGGAATDTLVKPSSDRGPGKIIEIELCDEHDDDDNEGHDEDEEQREVDEKHKPEGTED